MSIIAPYRTMKNNVTWQEGLPSKSLAHEHPHTVQTTALFVCSQITDQEKEPSPPGERKENGWCMMHVMACTRACRHACMMPGPDRSTLTQPKQLTVRDSDPTQHSIMKLPHAMMLRKSEKKPPAVRRPAGLTDEPASASTDSLPGRCGTRGRRRRRRR